VNEASSLSLVVFSGNYDRVHYALVLASAAAAVGRPVTLFFTHRAILTLTTDAGWRALPTDDGRSGGVVDDDYGHRGIATVAELLDACAEMNVRFLVCEMGLRAERLRPDDLRSDLPIGVAGVVTLLADEGHGGSLLFC
jgi:peroxiredoxin family protein